MIVEDLERRCDGRGSDGLAVEEEGLSAFDFGSRRGTETEKATEGESDAALVDAYGGQRLILGRDARQGRRR